MNPRRTTFSLQLNAMPSMLLASGLMIGACGGSGGEGGMGGAPTNSEPGGSASDHSEGKSPAPATGAGQEGSGDDLGEGMTPDEYEQAEDWQKQLVELINEQRAAGATCGGKKRPPVDPLSFHEEITPRLDKAAAHHAATMEEEGLNGHIDGNGNGMLYRIWVENRDWKSELGRGWKSVNEAVASGPSSPEEVVSAWMESNRYCDVLMSEDAGFVGLAREGDNWVLVTAKPLATPGPMTPDAEWKRGLLDAMNARRTSGATCGGESIGEQRLLEYSEHAEAAARYKAQDAFYTGETGARTSDGNDVGDVVKFILPEGWRLKNQVVFKGDTTPEKLVEHWMSKSSSCWFVMTKQLAYVGFARKGDYWVATGGTPQSFDLSVFEPYL